MRPTVKIYNAVCTTLQNAQHKPQGYNNPRASVNTCPINGVQDRVRSIEMLQHPAPKLQNWREERENPQYEI